MPSVHGLHHITAIAGDAQENLDFYAGVLGMRLVKRTVNQDVPGTYHLFYADALGHPGTDLTFFPWPDLPPAHRGVGHSVEVALAVPPDTLAWWDARLRAHGTTPGPIETRFGERVLPVVDPHGLPLALTETEDEREFAPWAAGPVDAAHQIRGLHGTRLWERAIEPTARFLTGLLGFSAAGEEDGWRRFTVDGGGSGRHVDVREMPGERRGEWGRGGVHHVAWRVPDLAAERALREELRAAGRRPTDVVDRFWFQSVYFLEPGGTLFELATDGPGFGIDEDGAHLGETLVLPPWFEAQRAQIEATLPPLVAPLAGRS